MLGWSLLAVVDRGAVGRAFRWPSMLLTSTCLFLYVLQSKLSERYWRKTRLSGPGTEESDPSASGPRLPDCGLGARIVGTRSVLLVFVQGDAIKHKGLAELAAAFCGTVHVNPRALPSLRGKSVYVCGDVGGAGGLGLEAAERVMLVGDLSHGRGDASWLVVDVGRVPVLVHGVGVYYRRAFDQDADFFNSIRAEHAFQNLTESTKPGLALRTGIYLTPVEQRGEDLHFRLLRCSSNFSGPTVNFGASDRRIVGALNAEVGSMFDNPAPLNHVLAQIYHHEPATGEPNARKGEKKAKIKAHSDKTKDMPSNGLLAFCTFYDDLGKLQRLESDPFDYGRKGISGLAKLHFRLKACVASRPDCSLTPQFTVTLYPNSVLFVPLSTNRLYTHEIRSSALEAEAAPTRMGYVVRCSSAEALHRGGQTFLKAADGQLAPLEPPTPEGMSALKALYAEENAGDGVVDYARKGPLLFSLNGGDYAMPRLHDVADEFRPLWVRMDDNPFEELFRSAPFEAVGKGRQGGVLVSLSEQGVPIVRTTTKYSEPAQCFGPVHERLAQQLQSRASLPAAFNNALIECYTNAYATMGFHSDQAQDLEEESSIALFSCYRDPQAAATPPRKLVVEAKEPGGGRFEIPLAHCSVVVFSVAANRRFRHKIVLDAAACPAENQWLGITFRTSRTFLQFQHGRAVLEGGVPLALAEEEQRREFFAMRRRENEGTDFAYPRLPYTISASDLLPPRPA